MANTVSSWQGDLRLFGGIISIIIIIVWNLCSAQIQAELESEALV